MQRRGLRPLCSQSSVWADGDDGQPAAAAAPGLSAMQLAYAAAAAILMVAFATFLADQPVGTGAGALGRRPL